jgi:hypothetical protein
MLGSTAPASKLHKLDAARQPMAVSLAKYDLQASQKKIAQEKRRGTEGVNQSQGPDVARSISNGRRGLGQQHSSREIGSEDFGVALRRVHCCISSSRLLQT